MKKAFLTTVFLITISTLLTACGSGSDEPDDVWAICGAVRNGDTLDNPVRVKNGTRITVVGIRSHNQVAVRTEDQREANVIKLQGIRDKIDPDLEQAAMQRLDSLGKSGYFYRAKENCVARYQGATLIPGQIMDDQNRHFAETLVQEGLVPVDTSSTQCGTQLINGCLLAIETAAQQ